MKIFRMPLSGGPSVELFSIRVAVAGPQEVFLGFKIEHVTQLNQKLENPSVVATMRIKRKAPRLSLSF